MVEIIHPENRLEHHEKLLDSYLSASTPLALTGAGISVACGIPDFRSAGGLWSVFAPAEYATLEVFVNNPHKAWDLYRAMGRVLLGKTPDFAHRALAMLEQNELLKGIITQNVDGLHQEAGSDNVLEIHGDHQHLHCIQCDFLKIADTKYFETIAFPICDNCGFVLKPNVVLFGEPVRRQTEIQNLVNKCDLLLVIGTSAQVYPAAELPYRVKENKGLIYEFNKEPTVLSSEKSRSLSMTDYLFLSDVEISLPYFVNTILQMLE